MAVDPSPKLQLHELIEPTDPEPLNATATPAGALSVETENDDTGAPFATTVTWCVVGFGQGTVGDGELDRVRARGAVDVARCLAGCSAAITEVPAIA